MHRPRAERPPRFGLTPLPLAALSAGVLVLAVAGFQGASHGSRGLLIGAASALAPVLAAAVAGLVICAVVFTPAILFRRSVAKLSPGDVYLVLVGPGQASEYAAALGTPGWRRPRLEFLCVGVDSSTIELWQAASEPVRIAIIPRRRITSVSYAHVPYTTGFYPAIELAWADERTGFGRTLSLAICRPLWPMVVAGSPRLFRKLRADLEASLV